MQGKINKKHLIIVFIICLLFNSILLLREITPGEDVDDINIYFGAAKLAGLDWSSATEASDGYHGQAYYIMFAPLFYFIKDALIRHLIIVIINTFVLSGVGVLIYYIAIRFFGQKSDYSTAIIAVIITSVTSIYTQGKTDNTVPVFMTIWVICLILLCLCREQRGKQRILLSVALFIALGYGVLTHVRMIGVVAAIALSTLIYYIITRRWVIDPRVFIPAIIIGSAGYVIVMEFIIGSFFGRNPEEVGNASLLVSLGLDNIPRFRTICDIFIANLYTLTVRTFGIAAISVTLLVYLFIALIRSIKKRKPADFLNDIGMPEDWFFIFLVFVICTFGTIFGLCLRYGYWLERMIERGVIDVRFTSGLEYTRYYAPYFGPVLLVLYSYILKRKKERMRLCLASLGVFILLAAYVQLLVIPYSGPIGNISWFFISNTGLQTTVIIIVFFLALYAFSFGANIQKHYFVSVFSILLILRLNSVSLPPPGIVPPPGAGQLYQVLNGINSKTQLPHEIYATYRPANIQFFFSHNRVIAGIPPEGTTDDCIFIGFSSQAENNAKLYGEGYGFRHYMLGSIAVWIRGDDLYEALREYAEETGIVSAERRHLLETGGDRVYLPGLGRYDMWAYQALYPDTVIIGDKGIQGVTLRP